jgi:archaellum biogenesis protein FlaJ (TadC family)
MYQYLSRILPKKTVENYRLLLICCDIRTDHDKFIGFVLLFGLGIAAVASIYMTILFSLSALFAIALFGLIYFVFELAIYGWLSLKAASKARLVEAVLPDALMMMSMNIKAGLTTDRALLESAREEFGPLAVEIKKAGKQILAGKDVRYALLDMPKRVRSKTFERTVTLIVEGIESGGELADLLQQTADDIQSTKMAENEVKATVMMYAIFIFFAAGIGAPLLFGISTYLVQVLGNQQAHFNIPANVAATGPFTGLKVMQAHVTVSADFLFWFATISLTITSIFGGLIIGIVKDGDEKQGIKNIPILLAISLTVFFIVRLMVGSILGGMA